MSKLTMQMIQPVVDFALAEDIGSGDATTLSVVEAEQMVEAEFRTREPIVFCGEQIIKAVYHALSKAIHIEYLKHDGDVCEAGDLLVKVSGNARAIITGERTALNFIQRMSGIATSTKAYVDALGNAKTVLLDTRKTTPGLRMIEKYAVSCGGAKNHRFGLYDMIMIKDNHRMLSDMQGPDGIQRSIKKAREAYPELEVEIEVDSLEQLEEALLAKADYILLDNMTNETMIEAVAMRNRLNSDSRLEASGGITIERIPSMSNIGVDFISVGALTHGIKSVDIGLDIFLNDATIFE